MELFKEEFPPTDPARDDDTLYILMTSHMVRMQSLVWRWQEAQGRRPASVKHTCPAGTGLPGEAVFEQPICIGQRRVV